jgi:hypothetical protein
VRKPFGAKQLAELVPGCIGPAAAERGFAAAELLSRWAEIAGPEIGARSRPIRFGWPPRGQKSDPAAPREGAVLHLRVDSGFALAFHYESPALVGRINSYLGWRCVEAIRVVQGPVARRSRAQLEPRPLPPAQEARLAETLTQVEGDVAGALTRLGRAVLSRQASPSPDRRAATISGASQPENANGLPSAQERTIP